MAKVSFNSYEPDRQIFIQLSEEQADVCNYQVKHFIEFLRAQGFCDINIFGAMDEAVKEFDEDNPGKLSEYIPF